MVEVHEVFHLFRVSAGTALADSLQLHLNLYDELSVQSSMLAQVAGVQSIFDPVLDVSEALKIALDAVGIVYALVAAPMWNVGELCTH